MNQLLAVIKQKKVGFLLEQLDVSHDVVLAQLAHGITLHPSRGHWCPTFLWRSIDGFVVLLLETPLQDPLCPHWELPEPLCFGCLFIPESWNTNMVLSRP